MTYKVSSGMLSLYTLTHPLKPKAFQLLYVVWNREIDFNASVLAFYKVVKVFRERLRKSSNISLPAGATHIYGNAVPTQNSSLELRSHAFPLHYTRALIRILSIGDKILLPHKMHSPAYHRCKKTFK